MRVCIQFLKNIDKEGEDVIQSILFFSMTRRTNLGELQLVASNMVRLLNMMRTYQLREELIHGLRIQIKEKREMMEEVQKQIDEAKDVLKKSMETLHTVSQTNLSESSQRTGIHDTRSCTIDMFLEQTMNSIFSTLIVRKMSLISSSIFGSKESMISAVNTRHRSYFEGEYTRSSVTPDRGRFGEAVPSSSLKTLHPRSSYPANCLCDDS